MGAEILTAKGGETIRGKVVGRKRDHDGNPVVDPSNDEPLYIVEWLQCDHKCAESTT